MYFFAEKKNWITLNVLLEHKFLYKDFNVNTKNLKQFFINCYLFTFLLNENSYVFKRQLLNGMTSYVVFEH